VGSVQHRGCHGSRVPDEVAYPGVRGFLLAISLYVAPAHSYTAELRSYTLNKTQAHARIQRAVDEDLAISRRTEQKLSDLCGHVEIMMSAQLLRAMGYSWEGSTGPRHRVTNFEMHLED